MRTVFALAVGVCVSLGAGVAAAAGDAAKGKEKSAVCAACHGTDGNSTAPVNPRLAGQHESYLYRALQDYKSGVGKNAVMAGFAGQLSDEDMQDLAAYFASQRGLATPD